jgi:hypothetical protein
LLTDRSVLSGEKLSIAVLSQTLPERLMVGHQAPELLADVLAFDLVFRDGDCDGCQQDPRD